MFNMDTKLRSREWQKDKWFKQIIFLAVTVTTQNKSMKTGINNALPKYYCLLKQYRHKLYGIS